MVEISFYYSEDSHSINFLPLIVEKAYSNGKKSLIYTSDYNYANEINSKLWSYSQLSFTPHLIFNEEIFKKNEIKINDIPIIITSDIITSEQSFFSKMLNYQFFFDSSFSYIPQKFFNNNFEKIIHLIEQFDDESLKKINNLISYYSKNGVNITCWIQSNKKWKKNNMFFSEKFLKIAS